MEDLFIKLRYIFKAILFAGIFAIFIHYFLVQPYVVPDNSLTPEYNRGEVVLVNRLPYFLGSYDRNEVIVYHDSESLSVKHLSRIRALPGEVISINDGILTIVGDQKLIKEVPLFGDVSLTLNKIGRLDAHEFFVLDNKGVDSEEGFVDIKDIVGRPILKIWPISKIKYLE